MEKMDKNKPFGALRRASAILWGEIMKTRRNGEGTMRQRKDGRFEVRTSVYDYETRTTKRISSYAETKEDAVHLMQKTGMQAVNQPRHLLSECTLCEWLRRYLELYAKAELKRSTYESYESYVRRYFEVDLGNVKLKELNITLLQSYYMHLYHEVGLSPKTIHNINNFLHKALQQAMNEQYILMNPADCVHLPRIQRGEIQVLSNKEQALLIQTSYYHAYGIVIRLALTTGMRVGEISGLRWNDVNLMAGYITVRSSLRRLQCEDQEEAANRTELVLQEPKTPNSIRSFYMLPQICTDLSAWKENQNRLKAMAGESYVDQNFVFANERGNPIEPRTMYDFLQQMLDMAGLPHYRFHDLRHTFATRALEAGMDPKVISEMMGHSSVQFTLDTYAHILPQRNKAQVEMLSSLSGFSAL